ncbi:MAG: hypothetical protein HQL63_02720 [Magnetococcales bacterium]|nr:hypothetical protein [Magnetococcales bacterium]MBF0322648.1 hypothetical protein [Magnetococcales bacterium]
MITAKRTLGNKRSRVPAKPSLLSNQRVEKRNRSRPVMKSTSERIFIRLPKLPSLRRAPERGPSRSMSAPVSATIRRVGGTSLRGATTVMSASGGILATLFFMVARSIQWSFITLFRTIQWLIFATGCTLQWSFFATRRTLEWTFHFLRFSWQWTTFALVSAALLLRQGVGIFLEWLHFLTEWGLYLLSELMTLLKKGVWHLMEATKQIAWFVTDVIQQGFFFLADIVQQIVWTLSDWIRGAVTFSTSEPDQEEGVEYVEDTDANPQGLLGEVRVEPELDLDQPLLVKGKKEWEGAHFEFAKMDSLDSEERAIPQEALEDQAGALRMRLSTDPYHP